MVLLHIYYLTLANYLWYNLHLTFQESVLRVFNDMCRMDRQDAPIRMGPAI